MSHELFHDVTERRPRANRATGGTLALSVLAHSLILAAVIVVPLVATDALPILPDDGVSPYAIDVMPPPPPLPPAVPRTRTATPVDSRDVAPVEPHDGIEAEVERATSIPCAACVVDPTADRFSGVGVIGGTGPTLPQPPPPPPPVERGPVRLSSYEMPKKLHDVAPRYPELAQKAGIDGTVIIEAVIAVDGTVRDARVLKSVPLLDRAALDAVRQWRYAPTRLSGVAVPVIVTVTVQFRLQR
jgi:protein TonB